MRKKASEFSWHYWNETRNGLFDTVSDKMFEGLKQGHFSITETRQPVHSEPITVLVVEDEALIRIAIVDELEVAGFQVFDADSAAAAIAIIERHADIRMIFTDIDMPGTMDGLKLAAFVRDRWPPIKIIVTSGRVIPGAAELPPGVPFVAKPYDFELVIRSIHAAMTE